ncbi:hypothetical protein PF005_g7983 [Phytophthora fragariae]|uniref:Uncharacterized protein n=1 Tax=Phytophthora fragariae TaxID=53985 RepID=A0A6A3FJ95_9STRA|nr:hypothetical protein PF009_g4505 [Phytophthora fragariae]KAE9001863.1 hypothetical protein PF011_g13567 [Phytophthora fragariae]KAE9100806.1 hypothetical protein PF010_g14671 [Phytophthora fragariae]KAE9117595.1 hypothetical protein PF007_g9220 [Phytophthora fragariae]KAE9140600.1 hypothetical protein PF006_g13500 [Phytophthora fragariae]
MFAGKPLGRGCAPLGPGSRQTWCCWPVATAGSLAGAAESDGGGMAQRATAHDVDDKEMRCSAAQKSLHHDGESLARWMNANPRN